MLERWGDDTMRGVSTRNTGAGILIGMIHLSVENGLDRLHPFNECMTYIICGGYISTYDYNHDTCLHTTLISIYRSCSN